MKDGEFDDEGYWSKLKQFAKAAGLEVIEKSLLLFYAAQQPHTPIWARTVIYSALTYFVVPIDAIPDFTPIVGYSDDLGALAAAVTTCGMYIDDEVKALARKKLSDWFD